MSSISNIVRRLRENRILNEREDYQSMSLNNVISLCQNGDQLAIEYLLKEYEPLLRKIGSKYVLDTQDSDDKDQIASIGFWDAIMKWDPERNEEKGFVDHITRIVNRKFTDALRQDSTEKTKFNTLANSIDDTIAGDEEGGELTIGDTLASEEASPEEQFLGKQGAREIMKFMRDKFSTQERDVIMRYIQGYKVSEIAEETGMKYKSVENALMRVKNKLADYLRTRESRRVRENKNIEFTYEEKKILESVIRKIDRQEAIKESYESYTENQLEEELDKIELAIEDITARIEVTPYNRRDGILSKLEDLEYSLKELEEYLPDDLYNRAEELLSNIRDADEIEYDGSYTSDPYKERGINRSDFY